MNLNVLSNNVRRMRKAKNISQSELASISGISIATIKNLELAKKEPQVKTIRSIARAMDVRLHELFLPVRELETIRFRSTKKMRNRENILAGISIWIDNYNYLEDILDDRIKFNLHISEASSHSEIVERAISTRKKLGLNSTEPIYDLCGLLESGGVKVRSISAASDGFFGLSIGAKDGGPAVIANIYDRISVERRIFSAAHELGHILLHPGAFNAANIEENQDEERHANLFAGHFLMPDKGFFKEWRDTSGMHIIDRVFKIKRIYRVSYKTVIRRLLDCEMVGNDVWMRFNYAYKSRYNQSLGYKEEPMSVETSEPSGLKEFDFFENRYSRLVRTAIEKDKISLSRGAEMLGISLEEMYDLIKDWEV